MSRIVDEVVASMGPRWVLRTEAGVAGSHWLHESGARVPPFGNDVREDLIARADRFAAEAVEENKAHQAELRARTHCPCCNRAVSL